MKKYIFLDFDGVLNTGSYQKQLKTEGKQRWDNNGPFFSPEAVKNLNTILESTGAMICITSSWAYEGEHKMRQIWTERNMPGTIHDICIDGLFSDEGMDMDALAAGEMVGRGRVIRHYLSRIHSSYNYVVLDDVKDFYKSQMQHVVLINPETGITAEDAEKTISILNNDSLTYKPIK